MSTPPRHVEFQDSEVGAVSFEAGRLRVLLSAASTHQDGVNGYLSGVLIEFAQARWDGALSQAVGALAEGVLQANSQRCHRIALPFEYSGPVSIELRFKSGALLSVQATQVAIVQAPGAAFTESMAC